MIAPHALAATRVTTAVATSAVVTTVVQRLQIVVVRTRALALRALTLRRARLKAAKSVVHSAVIAHTLALPLVMATVMIARRARSVTARCPSQWWLRVSCLTSHVCWPSVMRINGN